jgi:hypothetical protein
MTLGQTDRFRDRQTNRRREPNPLTRSYDSRGPDVRIRGTALHVAERYWNGHRFFGLRTAKSDRSATAGRRGGHDDVASADVGSRSIKESRAAHIRGSRREEASP